MPVPAFDLFRVYGGYPPLYLSIRTLRSMDSVTLDFRHVALTSLLCKHFLHCQLKSAVVGRMDRLQFAYRAGRGCRMPGQGGGV